MTPRRGPTWQRSCRQGRSKARPLAAGPAPHARRRRTGRGSWCRRKPARRTARAAGDGGPGARRFPLAASTSDPVPNSMDSGDNRSRIRAPETTCPAYRTNPRHVDLAVVRLPLLSSAPEPAPHRMTAAAVRSRCLVPEGTSRQPTRDRPAGDFTGVTTAAACQEGHSPHRPQRAVLPLGTPEYLAFRGQGPSEPACARRGALECPWPRRPRRRDLPRRRVLVARVPPAGSVHAGAGPAQHARRRRPVEGHSADVGVRRAPHMPGAIVDLTLVRLPLVASAPEPDLHSPTGGGRPVEEHGAGGAVRPATHGPPGW